jgi:hypothetical protein
MLPSRSFSSLWRADGNMVERRIRTVSGFRPAFQKMITFYMNQQDPEK